MSNKTLDVLIVGAGPVGLFCANEAARHGLSFRVIDKKTGLSDKSKALGLHIRTLDLLDEGRLVVSRFNYGLGSTRRPDGYVS